MVLLIVALIIHETGHLLALIILNIKFKRIKVTFFGFNIDVDLEEVGFIKKFILFFSGPLVNIVMYLFFDKLDYHEFSEVNLFLGCVNLIPVVPLDGGNICKSLMEKNISKSVVAGYIMKTNGFFIIYFAVNAVIKRNLIFLILILMAFKGIFQEKDNLLANKIKSNYYKTMRGKR